MTRMESWMAVGALLVCLAMALAAGAQDAPPGERQSAQNDGTIRELGGWDAAQQRLGSRMPTGSGVVFGHVEGNGDAYMPDTGGDRFAGVRLIGRTGKSKPFEHATGTASVIYGPRGLAPGVQLVHFFSTPAWLGGSYLRTGLPLPPSQLDIDVFTHSWIADDHPKLEEILRRVDWVVDERDVIVCVGVNNGRNTRVPAMLSSSHNAIAVGTAEANGASSGGYTHFEGIGRSKPDIVGPRRLTSFATPTVAAAAGLLLEQARRLDEPFRSEARHSEVIKAVLLAGATKPWGWNQDGDHPLDEHLGAGIVNVDNSLRMLESPPSPVGAVARAFGWNLSQLAGGHHETYDLKVTEPTGPLSIVIAWNRRIDGRTRALDPTTGLRWLDTPRTADFDLVFSRQVDSGQVQAMKISRSRVDNVEHIHIARLEPGSYRIDVLRRRDTFDEPWDYAVAWRIGE